MRWLISICVCATFLSTPTHAGNALDPTVYKRSHHEIQFRIKEGCSLEFTAPLPTLPSDFPQFVSGMRKSDIQEAIKPQLEWDGACQDGVPHGEGSLALYWTNPLDGQKRVPVLGYHYHSHEHYTQAFRKGFPHIGFRSPTSHGTETQQPLKITRCSIQRRTIPANAKRRRVLTATVRVPITWRQQPAILVLKLAALKTLVEILKPDANIAECKFGPRHFFHQARIDVVNDRTGQVLMRATIPPEQVRALRKFVRDTSDPSAEHQTGILFPNTMPWFASQFKRAEARYFRHILTPHIKSALCQPLPTNLTQKNACVFVGAPDDPIPKAEIGHCRDMQAKWRATPHSLYFPFTSYRACRTPITFYKSLLRKRQAVQQVAGSSNGQPACFAFSLASPFAPPKRHDCHVHTQRPASQSQDAPIVVAMLARDMAGRSWGEIERLAYDRFKEQTAPRSLCLVSDAVGHQSYCLDNLPAFLWRHGTHLTSLAHTQSVAASHFVAYATVPMGTLHIRLWPIILALAFMLMATVPLFLRRHVTAAPTDGDGAAPPTLQAFEPETDAGASASGNASSSEKDEASSALSSFAEKLANFRLGAASDDTRSDDTDSGVTAVGGEENKHDREGDDEQNRLSGDQHKPEAETSVSKASANDLTDFELKTPVATGEIERIEKQPPFKLIFKRGQIKSAGRIQFASTVLAEMAPQFEKAVKDYGLWNELVWHDPLLEKEDNEAFVAAVARTGRKQRRAHKLFNFYDSMPSIAQWYLFIFWMTYKIWYFAFWLVILLPLKILGLVFRINNSIKTHETRTLRFSDLKRGKTFTMDNLAELMDIEDAIEKSALNMAEYVKAAVDFGGDFAVTERQDVTR